jgi:hypothetical protein
MLVEIVNFVPTLPIFTHETLTSYILYAKLPRMVLIISR